MNRAVLFAAQLFILQPVVADNIDHSSAHTLTTFSENSGHSREHTLTSQSLTFAFKFCRNGSGDSDLVVLFPSI